MKGNKGFTLIELMIVVEIIAIVAAIAVPNYIRTRIQANEASAVASLRVILDAQISYNTQNYVYASDIALLTNANPPYLEGGDWTSAKNGYEFRVEGGAINFVAYATPVEYNTTGWHAYRIDHQGAIRYAVGAEPDETSPLITGST
jgi:prepilin-type N-terminal cleavage/methylation domain-containing protein